MSRGGARSFGVLTAALVAASGTARASERPEPIQIVMSAPRACPPASVFEAELRGRTRRPWVRGGRASPRTIRVAITPSERLFRGRLIIEEPSGSTRSDEVPWERCEDVVSALAVKAAIIVDGSSPEALPAIGPRAQPQPLWADLRWSSAPAMTKLDEPPKPWRLTIGADLSAMGAVSPRLALTPSIFLDVSRAGDGFDALSIRLSILRAIDDFQTENQIVTMQWIASRLEACPYHQRLSVFTLSPCVGADTGAIEWAVDAPGVGRHWLDLTMIGRAQATLFGRLVLEAQAGVIVPLTRYEFGLGQQRLYGKSLHKVPAISGLIGGGTAVRFP